MGWFGMSSNQSTWAISIVGDDASAAKSVEGLASNPPRRTDGARFPACPEVSQEHEHAHFAEGTTGRLLKDEALPVPAHD